MFISNNTKYLLVQLLIISCYCEKFSQRSLDSKRNATKIYLTDLIKKIELSDLNDKKTNTSTSQNSIVSPEMLSKISPVNYANSQCQLVQKNVSVNIGPGCPTIDWPIVECSGYCRSKALMWKNEDEIQEGECCTMSSAYYENVRIYCTEKIDFEQVRNNLTEGGLKSVNLLEFVLNSFVKKVWSTHVIVREKQIYAGFYTVRLVYNGICECKNF